jgi:hypothetical protein
MAAVAAGWIIAAGGYILTVVVFSLFNPETFTPGVPLPWGWLLVTLAASAVWSVAAGFVAGVIAGRREIEHGVALALFGLVVSVCFLAWNRNLAQVPTWYLIAGEALTSLAIPMGAWLRRNQRILLVKVHDGVIPAPDAARLSIAIRVDRWRFRIAAAVTVITFLACLWALVLGAGRGLLW